MLYIATARLVVRRRSALGLFLVGSFAVYRGRRTCATACTNWLSPWTTHAVLCPLNGQMALRQDCQSYQQVQSLYSIAPRRLGRHWPRPAASFTDAAGQQIIPDLNTDFIYSALAQELGLIGAAALLLLYMVVRPARLPASRSLASDGFSKLLAAGLSFGFALQTFVIVGGILRVIPLTGITLPLRLVRRLERRRRTSSARGGADARSPTAPTERGAVA